MKLQNLVTGPIRLDGLLVGTHYFYSMRRKTAGIDLVYYMYHSRDAYLLETMKDIFCLPVVGSKNLAVAHYVKKYIRCSYR